MAGSYTHQGLMTLCSLAASAHIRSLVFESQNILSSSNNLWLNCHWLDVTKVLPVISLVSVPHLISINKVVSIQ